MDRVKKNWMRRISMTIRPSFMSHSLGWLQLEHLFYTLLEVLLPYEPVCPALGRLLYHNFLGRPRQITLSVCHCVVTKVEPVEHLYKLLFYEMNTFKGKQMFRFNSKKICACIA